jgi:hypothetical protein
MEALERLPQVPEPLTWTSGLAMGRTYDRIDLLREWTIQYRAQYAEAARLAKEESGSPGGFALPIRSRIDSGRARPPAEPGFAEARR